MGEAIITRRSAGDGGSMSGGVAVILVTYPVGSTCTCTDETTVLTASNTSGSAVFFVPNIGTWTVKSVASDSVGTSKSASVSITAEGQVEEVTLVYKLVLHSTSTGLASGYSLSTRSISPAIDVTAYKTMTITFRRTWASANYSVIIGLSSAINENPSVARVSTDSSSFTTLYADLSSMTGKYYLSFQNASSLSISSDNQLIIQNNSWTGAVTNITFTS